MKGEGVIKEVNNWKVYKKDVWVETLTTNRVTRCVCDRDLSQNLESQVTPSVSHLVLPPVSVNIVDETVLGPPLSLDLSLGLGRTSVSPKDLLYRGCLLILL